MIKIKIQNNTATREPLPPFLVGLDPTSLLDLSWTDPALGVQDCAWWPEERAGETFDPDTHKLGDEVLTVDATRRVVIVSHAIVPLDADELAAIAKRDAGVVADKIGQLWAAADRYVSGYISGVAIGILTLGVIQRQPKSQAVAAWSQAVWAEYYARKAGVTPTSPLNLDFAALGPMPHSVPELQAEAMGA